MGSFKKIAKMACQITATMWVGGYVNRLVGNLFDSIVGQNNNNKKGNDR